MRPIYRRPLVAGVLALSIAVLSVLPVVAYHLGELTDVHPVANDAFGERHNRTDQPVIDGQQRTWIWGPEPYTEGMLEPYVDAPGGMRLVQYWDKSRMEINNPSGDASDLWYVTNGLLVIDMIEGRYQIGDEEFDASPEPADIQIAGDPDVASEITYAAIGALGLRDEPALAVGTPITLTIQEGTVVLDDDYDEYDVIAQHRVQVDGIDHTVASVFWDFMNSEGIVYENHQATTDRLFINPFYATGYPITEAYWATVDVAGYPNDVLWQCFERRCLTYTPGNDEGWKVETGNVGQHYFQWRYGPEGPDMQQIELAYVAIGDGGTLGPEIGCQDSLIMVDAEIQQFEDVEHSIHAALQKLLVAEHELWSNTLFGQNAILESVSVANGVATIRIAGQMLSGGVCDDPRITEPIRATAVQFDGVEDVEILVNGQPWPAGGN